MSKFVLNLIFEIYLRWYFGLLSTSDAKRNLGCDTGAQEIRNIACQLKLTVTVPPRKEM